MSPVAVLLVVAAAFAHAGWNLAAKRVRDGGALFVWLNATVSAALLVPVVLSTATPSWDWVVPLAGSGVLHLGYFLLLQRGYATGDLSVVYPLARGTGPLLTVVAAVAVFGERPHPLGLVGAVAVVVGVLVIGSGGSGQGSRVAGAVYGLATGAMIAGYTLWDAHAVTAAAIAPVALMAGSSVTESVLLAPYALTRPQLKDLARKYWREVCLVAVLSPAAYVLVLFAMKIAPVSLVAPARELSIVIGSVLAWLVLGEPNPVRRLSGAVIVVAGVAAIALA
ncbi:EamA family transporter [Saccharothrix variisporea]|uniref:EamA-like transporter family protein n=1 Tax=Saccharothrix variisporea TaxID=543527 RepID=A0A495XB17_9PSEU|nr:EamA family transporter [Saccharothrix variisporea]RKT70044.1 EamA-like transporter family protein [Saccharothrix variisporea]